MLVEKKAEQVGERPLSARHFSESNATSRRPLAEAVNTRITTTIGAPNTMMSTRGTSLSYNAFGRTVQSAKRRRGVFHGASAV